MIHARQTGPNQFLQSFLFLLNLQFELCDPAEIQPSWTGGLVRVVRFLALYFLEVQFFILFDSTVRSYMLGCTDFGPKKTLVQDLQRSRLFAPGWNWSCEPGVTIGGESPSHHHHHHHHHHLPITIIIINNITIITTINHLITITIKTMSI